jgi:cell division initiation protein
MIDLTPLDVRKKKGDFRRAVRGYDTELVDDFLDMAAERLEELVKQNVALTERAEHLQEQVASYREREMALNEALVTAQQLRSEAQAQADREAELVRREAQGQAERIVEEGQRSFRELARQIEMIQARKNHFVRAFRTLLERYLAELELDEVHVNEAVVGEMASTTPEEPAQKLPAEPVEPKQSDWLSSLVAESDKEESG